MPIRHKTREEKPVAGHKQTRNPEDLTEISLQERTTERMARGFQILSCFRDGHEHLTNLDISERTEIPKPTVSRMTASLLRLGYLAYDNTLGSYRLDFGLLALARPLLIRDGFHSLLRPRMVALAEETGMTVAIGRRSGAQMVYTDVIRSKAPVTLALGVGSIVPLMSSALGRAYLATLPPEQRADIVNETVEQQDMNLSEAEAIVKAAVDDYESVGYCVSIRELHPDVNATAVAIIAPDDGSIVSIVCGAPASLLTVQLIREEIGPKLRTMAQELTFTS